MGKTSGRLGGFLFHVTPNLRISPNTAARGSTATVQGVGFGAGEIVRIYWNNDQRLLGEVMANNRGSFINPNGVNIAIPTDAAHGANTVLGIGDTTRAMGKGKITVQ